MASPYWGAPEDFPSTLCTRIGGRRCPKISILKKFRVDKIIFRVQGDHKKTQTRVQRLMNCRSGDFDIILATIIHKN